VDTKDAAKGQKVLGETTTLAEAIAALPSGARPTA
jgi:hypothetical protein